MPRLLLCSVLLLLPVFAQASAVKSVLPDAELRGAATFRFIGFPLYEARLFTKSGTALDWNKDFGLELKYLRNLSEYDLVTGTMREINRTGAALPVRGQLEQCFEDVRKGDREPGQLVIYSQGTRVKPGVRAEYKVGTAVLYEQLGQTCVPVATNAGFFWPRRGLYRRPGVAVVQYLDPIPPGLDRKTFMSTLETEVENASDALLEEALKASDG